MTEDTVIHRLRLSQADAHYAEHVDKAFYPPLKEFMTSGPCLPVALERDNAVKALDSGKRPVSAVADSTEIRDVVEVAVWVDWPRKVLSTTSALRSPFSQ